MDLNLTPNSCLLYTHLIRCPKVILHGVLSAFEGDLSYEIRNVAPVIMSVLKHFRF